MSYQFERGQIYRMPTHFGPAPGPRQMPRDMPSDARQSPRRISIGASYLTDAQCLERHMPNGFALSGEPVITVEFHYMTGIDWLAGRGYTMVHVGWPATFFGRQDKATGRFLAVVWENLADPIITGRDEIGHPKLYAEIAEPRVWDGRQICVASWMGFRFLEMEVSGLKDAEPASHQLTSDGTLMLKYVPSTEAWGETALSQVTLTPTADPDRTVEARQAGDAVVKFNIATWSDLPTMAHVTNALAEMPILEMRGGTMLKTRGGKTYRDQKVLW